MLQAGSETQISARMMVRIGDTFIVFSLVGCLLGANRIKLTRIKEEKTSTDIFSIAGEAPRRGRPPTVHVVTWPPTRSNSAARSAPRPDSLQIATGDPL